MAKIVLDLHDIYNKGFTIDADITVRSITRVSKSSSGKIMDIRANMSSMKIITTALRIAERL